MAEYRPLGHHRYTKSNAKLLISQAWAKTSTQVLIDGNLTSLTAAQITYRARAEFFHAFRLRDIFYGEYPEPNADDESPIDISIPTLSIPYAPDLPAKHVEPVPHVNSTAPVIQVANGAAVLNNEPNSAKKTNGNAHTTTSQGNVIGSDVHINSTKKTNGTSRTSTSQENVTGSDANLTKKTNGASDATTPQGNATGPDTNSTKKPSVVSNHTETATSINKFTSEPVYGLFVMNVNTEDAARALFSDENDKKNIIKIGRSGMSRRVVHFKTAEDRDNAMNHLPEELKNRTKEDRNLPLVKIYQSIDERRHYSTPRENRAYVVPGKKQETSVNAAHVSSSAALPTTRPPDKQPPTGPSERGQMTRMSVQAYTSSRRTLNPTTPASPGQQDGAPSHRDKRVKIDSSGRDSSRRESSSDLRHYTPPTQRDIDRLSEIPSHYQNSRQGHASPPAAMKREAENSFPRRCPSQCPFYHDPAHETGVVEFHKNFSALLWNNKADVSYRCETSHIWFEKCEESAYGRIWISGTKDSVRAAEKQFNDLIRSRR